MDDANQIEVTPEMVAVGLDIYYRWMNGESFGPLTTDETFVVTLYRCMAAKSPSG